MAHGQQSDFIIKVYKAFYNDTTLARTAAGLGIVPGFLDIAFAFDGALAFA